MSHLGNAFAVVLLVSSSTIFGQSSEVSIQSPPPPKYVGRFLKPFHLDKRMVAPARLNNSARLESLVRGGNLYLSVQDVIALALENNLDIAVQRYSPFLAREVLRRAEGGGFLRQVDTPVAAGPTSVSTAGISINANGLGGGGGSGRGRRNRQPDRAGASEPGSESLSERQRGALHHPADQHATEPNHRPDADYQQFVFQYSQQFVTGTSGHFTFVNSAACSTVPRRCSTPRLAGISTCRSIRICCKGGAWASITATSGWRRTI